MTTMTNAARMFVAGLAMMLIVASCGDDTLELAAADVERLDAPVSRAGPVAGAYADFGWDLYRQLADGGNLVFSPHSIGIALTMTRAGAAGVTAAEMDQMLHLAAVQNPHGSANALDLALAAAPGTIERPDGTTAAIELEIANAIWAQQGFGFEQPFLVTLAENYGAGTHLVDYEGSHEAAREEINTWVADKTSARIDELIAPGVLSPATRLVLTNAVYLKAPWQHPFDEGATTPGDFTTLDGSTSTVDLMSVSASFRYGRVGDLQAIELPYVGDELAMLVIVPDKGMFEAVSASLDARQVGSILQALRPTSVDLRLPKFEFTTTASLVPTLAELGMRTAIDPDEADFSAMTTEARLFISDVVHEAFIAVDEAGTEAAAATAVVMDLTAAPVDPQALTVDRPFLIVLRHRVAGAVLFMGHITEL